MLKNFSNIGTYFIFKKIIQPPCSNPNYGFGTITNFT